jgi:hypothetical protein
MLGTTMLGSFTRWAASTRKLRLRQSLRQCRRTAQQPVGNCVGEISDLSFELRDLLMLISFRLLSAAECGRHALFKLVNDGGGGIGQILADSTEQYVLHRLPRHAANAALNAANHPLGRPHTGRRSGHHQVRQSRLHSPRTTRRNECGQQCVLGEPGRQPVTTTLSAFYLLALIARFATLRQRSRVR